MYVLMEKLRKVISKLSLLPLLIWSTGKSRSGQSIPTLTQYTNINPLMDSSILINWMSPFNILGLSDLFIFDNVIKAAVDFMQTAKTLIRGHHKY